MNRPSFKRQSVVHEYRVYYDPVSKVCTEKSVTELPDNSNYVIIDKTLYDSIEFCSKYRVIDGRVEKAVTYPSNIRLTKQDTGQFRTIKNNMIFVVGDAYTDPVDRWEYTTND